jgi:hypothetical protein
MIPQCGQLLARGTADGRRTGSIRYLIVMMMMMMMMMIVIMIEMEMRMLFS